MVEISISQTTELQINWLVARIKFPEWWDEMDHSELDMPHGISLDSGSMWEPCIDCNQGWPIIKEERIHLCPVIVDGKEEWQCWLDGVSGLRFMHADPLIAAMRCHIVSKMGDRVLVPSTLV